MKTPQSSPKRWVPIILSVFVLLMGVAPALAGDDDGSLQKRAQPSPPTSLEDSFAYMAELAQAPAQTVPLNIQRLTPTVTYLLDHPDSGRDLHLLPKVAAMPGAYHSFRIQRPLAAVLSYAYNPDIPQVAFRPTSIRLTYWSEINGRPKAAFPRLWPLLSKLESAYQLRGEEVTEITPDLFSKAYFRYKLDTRVILMKHEGRRLFLFISKQAERSEVGKKGAIIGGDQAWTYLYAASAGLAKPGLGWVKSYIYDSLSIIIYAEPIENQNSVQVGVFKWLSAGWAGLNMVKPMHIHEGLLRFADPFKTLLERPDLPAPEWLASYFRPLEEMSVEDLRGQVRRYHERLCSRYADQSPFNNAGLAKLFGDPAYADGLDRIQMEALLAKDYAKPIFGRESLLPRFPVGSELRPSGDGRPAPPRKGPDT
jgi:hypothetical protein